MRRAFVLILIFICFSACFSDCYAPALFLDRQFGYRDASPLLLSAPPAGAGEWHQRALAALGARGERGNAASGKPDGRGSLSGQAGVRVIALCLGCPDLHRRAYGACIRRDARLDAVLEDDLVRLGDSALAYAFGVPILFQYCNIIFWLVRPGCRWEFVRLKAGFAWDGGGGCWSWRFVLSMQMLGGDPQAAYLRGALVAIGYAMGLAWTRGRRLGRTRRPRNEVLRGPEFACWVPLTVLARGVVAS